MSALDLPRVWALDGQVLAGVQEAAERHTARSGGHVRRTATMREAAKGVLVVPIVGIIGHRAGHVGLWAQTSVEHVRADLQAALADRQVHTIVLQIDSPGGGVVGISELASEIRAAREHKRVVACSDGLMVSAAYWLACSASKVYASASAVVGDLGIVASYLDGDRAAKNAGFDAVTIRSVPGKGIGQGRGGIGDADVEKLQRQIDGYHRMLCEDIAAGRGVGIGVGVKLADGQRYLGREALEKGLVDRVRTVDETIRRLATPPSSKPHVAKVKR